MIFPPHRARLISGGLVGCMFVVAWGEMQHHGRSPADVHLITSVQLAPGSSVVSHVGTIHHESAIIDAQYRGAASSRPLHLDGLTHRST